VGQDRFVPFSEDSAVPHAEHVGSLGPAWDMAQDIEGQPEWTAHAEFMDALAGDGFIVLGGPVADRTRFEPWEILLGQTPAT
jgi:hypothetical protein